MNTLEYILLVIIGACAGASFCIIWSALRSGYRQSLNAEKEPKFPSYPGDFYEPRQPRCSQCSQNLQTQKNKPERENTCEK